MVALTTSSVMKRARLSKSQRTPVDLIIDECHTFIGEDIKLALTEARKYGLACTLAQQVVGQEMNTKLKQIIMGNTGLKIIGSSGHHSQKEMEREMSIRNRHMETLKTGQFIIK